MRIVPEPCVPIIAVDATDLTVLERAKLACNTFNTLFPDAPLPSEEDKIVSRTAFQAMTGLTPTTPPTLGAMAHYPNSSLVHLDALLSEYDKELVNSAVRIREYVKNKLIAESENPDGKIRIRALELLGKIKDVGLFTDRIEITNKDKTDEELEGELKSKLESYLGSLRVIEGETLGDDDENASELLDSALETPKPTPPVDVTPMDSVIDMLMPKE